MNKYTQSYIKGLLAEAAKVDPRYEVFGASNHKYQLNPPVSLNEVHTMEEKLQIKLPEEYVYFLTEIGNGGAGPYYGVLSLEEHKQWQAGWQQDGMMEPVIDNSLTMEKWNKLMERMDTDDDDVYEETFRHINIGVFVIGTQGCTYDNLLMCSGSETGKIVYIDWNLESDSPPFLTKMSFLEWYVGFFEDIVAGYSVDGYGYYKRCSEKQLKEDYEKSVTRKDKLDNLQGLMRFDKLSAETIDVLYRTQDTQTDRARLSILLKFQTDIGMKLFDQFINGANVSVAVSVLREIPKKEQQKYYQRAVEILHEDIDCNKKTILFYICDQEQKKAADIIEFATALNLDKKLLGNAIYVMGTCEDAVNFEDYFITWMKGEDYRVALTALQAAISMNHRSCALMETFQWMAEKYRNDKLMCSNLKKVL